MISFTTFDIWFKNCVSKGEAADTVLISFLE
nr:MAG TPA: hypothetical protein [Caudoviricetes sp.]